MDVIWFTFLWQILNDTSGNKDFGTSTEIANENQGQSFVNFSDFLNTWFLKIISSFFWVILLSLGSGLFYLEKQIKQMNFRTATIKKTNLDLAIQKRNHDQAMKILLLSHMLIWNYNSWRGITIH